MPVSHVSLTVSHLPRSCSFYLSALQPLGYRFISQQDNKIGFGDSGADFFISQCSSEYKPGPAHIAFTANSKEEVDSFYQAALKAGGTDHDKPNFRNHETGYYSAAVIDFDDNAVEVVYRDSEKSMVLTSAADRNQPKIQTQEQVPPCESFPFRTIVERITTTTTSTTISQPQSTQEPDSNSNSKTLVGTLLGAAAGAAIAYVMTKEDSPKPTSQQPPVVAHHAIVRHTVGSSPQQPPQSPASVHDHDSISYISEPSSQSTIRARAIEAPLTSNTTCSSSSLKSSTVSKSHLSFPKETPLALKTPSTISSKAESQKLRRDSNHHIIETSNTVIPVSRRQRTYPFLGKKPSALTSPSISASETQHQNSNTVVQPLAIEAPPSMFSTSSKRRLSRRHPPAPTYYTVKDYPAPSELHSNTDSSTKASRTTRRSKASTIKTITTVKTVRPARSAANYPLPPSTISVRTREQHHYSLPDSSHGSRGLESDRTSISTSRREPKLPANPDSYEVEPLVSHHGSKYAAESEAYKVELPPSSHYTQSQRSQRRSRHSSNSPSVENLPAQSSKCPQSSHDRSPHEIPLPASARTSFVSRARSPPRSATSASTIRPLTAQNIRRAATENGVDDLETVLPEDSISQMGSKAQKEAHRRFSETGSNGHKHRRRSDPTKSEGGRSHRSHGHSSRSNRKASTRVSMPRSIQRALGVITA